LPDVLAVWAFVLEKASASEERGNFGDVDCEAVDCLFGLDDGKTALILEHMGDRGLVDAGNICAWEKRQPKREDETSTDRKRRQREREHEIRMAEIVTCNPSRNVTHGHADVTHGHARGEERREEKSKDTFSDESVGAAEAPPAAPNPPKPPKPTEKKAEALPDDWQLPLSWGEWALSEYPHWTRDVIRLEAEKFADHWRSKSGKESRRADWQATWRNWCRSDIAQRTHATHARAQPISFAQQEEQARRKRWEEMTGRKWPTGIESPIEFIDAEPQRIA
jgi:hypothetical protein